jgi:glutamine cyclotransferase
VRRPPTAVWLASAALLAVGWLPGCGTAPPEAQALRVQVVATYQHDPSMFTQGLEIDNGVLYEGSGEVGKSRVRAVALPSQNEQAHQPAPASTEAALPAPMFGEGITVAGNRLWQLTWRDGVAIERDPVTLAERRRVHYQGEGWGLCHEGNRLVMSDGSDRLTFRDPQTFAATGQLSVQLDGEPAYALNELECAHGMIWANVWQSDRILRIDPSTGEVTAVVNATGLLDAKQQATADVLNGIAAIPGTDQFLITGKNWPTMFLVRFVPA